MLEAKVKARLDRLLAAAVEISLKPEDKLVIFSDLHLGQGGGKDDFAKNAPLYVAALEGHYYQQGFTLILNGDIEELARFELAPIEKKWHEIYALWNRFAVRGSLIKLIGNHDQRLARRHAQDAAIPVVEAVKFRMGENLIFLFHGHQTSNWNWVFQTLGSLLLRWILRPLGVGNYVVAHSSRRRFRVEKRVYLFARERKLLAAIGHTHRPLFESLSRLDAVKIEIENLCRLYPQAEAGQKTELERKLADLKEEYVLRQQMNHRCRDTENLYQEGPLLPCLFNSGCGIGRNGITAIEIAAGSIALVYWFDGRKSTKYFNSDGIVPEPLAGTDFYRVVLKQENLDYLFTRIRLLG